MYIKRSDPCHTESPNKGKPYPSPIDELQSSVARIQLHYNSDQRTIQVLRETVAELAAVVRDWQILLGSNSYDGLLQRAQVACPEGGK